MSATTTTDQTELDHPARYGPTERMLDELGVDWIFHPTVPIERVDQAASLSNQVRHEPLNEDTVERYAQDMKSGDVLPAVVATEVDASYIILGGNHRDAAHRRCEHETQPAYIVVGDRLALLQIAIGDNRNHGLPTTKEERLDQGLALIEAGILQREAARIVGVTQPDLTIHAGVRKLASRVTDHGEVERILKLPKTTRYELSRIDDDDVLDAMAELTVDAGVPAGDVRRMVAALNASEDKAEALAFVGAEREDRDAQVRARGGGVRQTSRTPRARFDGALSEILALSPKGIADSCPNDDVRRALARKISRVAAVLQPTMELLTRE